MGPHDLEASTVGQNGLVALTELWGVWAKKERGGNAK